MPRASLPQPRSLLDALAQRWSLPSEMVVEAWRDFVEASGGAFTDKPPRVLIEQLDALFDGEPVSGEVAEEGHHPGRPRR